MKRGLFLMVLTVCFGLTVWAQQVEEDPRAEFMDVNSIKDFKALPENTEARLKLCYDTVVFVQDGDAYVRDGNRGGAINFKNTGLDLKQGMVIYGTVVGRLVFIDGKAQFLATENTTDKYFIVTSELDFSPRQYEWGDDSSGQYVDDVVTIGEVTVDSLADNVGVRRLYAYKRSNGLRILLTDRYGFINMPVKIPAMYQNLRGIFAQNGKENELYLLTDMGTGYQPTAVTLPRHGSNSYTSIFDLQGRPMKGIPQHGIYVKNGRKEVK